MQEGDRCYFDGQQSLLRPGQRSLRYPAGTYVEQRQAAVLIFFPATMNFHEPTAIFSGPMTIFSGPTPIFPVPKRAYQS